MPVVPMYDLNVAPPNWRGSFYPGGYEFFEIQIQQGEINLLAQIGCGNPRDAEYLRQYRRFLRRPTRCKPPMPAEYPFAMLQLRGAERINYSSTIADPRYELKVENGSSISCGPGKVALVAQQVQVNWSDSEASLSMCGQLSSEISVSEAEAGHIREEFGFMGMLNLAAKNFEFSGNAIGRFTHSIGPGDKRR